MSKAFVPYKTTFDNNITKVATWIKNFSVAAKGATIQYLYVKGGNPAKVAIYVLIGSVVTEIIKPSSGDLSSFSITYNSSTDAFDCSASTTVEAWTQLYLLP